MADCGCAGKRRVSASSRRWPELIAIGGALAASNCCVIQLVLNMLSVGCAGFAVLDPVKPYAKLATVAAVARMLMSHGLSKRTLLVATAAVLLLSSQDLLSRFNKGQLPFLHARGHGAAHAAEEASSLGSHSERGGMQQPVRLLVEGMKCEGCASRLKMAVQELPGVREVQVDFQSKHVLVHLAEQTGIQPMSIDGLQAAIRSLDPSYDPQIMLGGEQPA